MSMTKGDDGHLLADQISGMGCAGDDNDPGIEFVMISDVTFKKILILNT
jgi:hypothetical protein